MVLRKPFRRGVFVSILALLLFCQALPAAMAAELNSKHTGSVHIACHVDGEALSGVEFKLYNLGSYDSITGQFTLDPVYEKYNLKFDSPTFAASLYAYFKRDGMACDSMAVSDSRGELNFENLDTGMYLIACNDFVKSNLKYIGTPMLVYLPHLKSDGNMSYAAELEAKFNIIKIDRPGPSKETITRKVLKIWECDDEDIPGEIQVELLRDGRSYDIRVLNARNNWRYTWTDLSPDYEWTVVEHDISVRFELDIQKQGATYVLTNYYNPPEKPEIPVVPETPVNPPEPPVQVPEIPTPGAPAIPTIPVTPVIPSDPGKPFIPQTGQLWWPVPVLTVAGLGFLILGIAKSGRKNSGED